MTMLAPQLKPSGDPCGNGLSTLHLYRRVNDVASCAVDACH